MQSMWTRSETASSAAIAPRTACSHDSCVIRAACICAPGHAFRSIMHTSDSKLCIHVCVSHSTLQLYALVQHEWLRAPIGASRQ